MIPPNRPWFWIASLTKRRASTRPALAYDVHYAVGRPARTTAGLARAAMSGTRSTQEESARRASTRGLQPNISLAPAGRRTPTGIRPDTLGACVKIGTKHESSTAVTQDTVTILPGSRFRAAMVLAMMADALQIVVFPLFVQGALSPADDVLDLAVAAVLVRLLGWHWEFLPAFAAELVPGVDLVPFWTLAVANVYRKWKQITVTAEETGEQRPALKDPTIFVSRESDGGQDDRLQRRPQRTLIPIPPD
jgi:hypothetical protein